MPVTREVHQRCIGFFDAWEPLLAHILVILQNIMFPRWEACHVVIPGSGEVGVWCNSSFNSAMGHGDGMLFGVVGDRFNVLVRSRAGTMEYLWL